LKLIAVLAPLVSTVDSIVFWLMSAYVPCVETVPRAICALAVTVAVVGAPAVPSGGAPLTVTEAWVMPAASSRVAYGASP